MLHWSIKADARRGKNDRRALAGLFRQSVFGRLAGYEDVNDAERLQHNPAIVPAVSAVHVAGTQSTAFEVAKLVEHEQRVIAGSKQSSRRRAAIEDQRGAPSPHWSRARQASLSGPIAFSYRESRAVSFALPLARRVMYVVSSCFLRKCRIFRAGRQQAASVLSASAYSNIRHPLLSVLSAN